MQSRPKCESKCFCDKSISDASQTALSNSSILSRLLERNAKLQSGNSSYNVRFQPVSFCYKLKSNISKKSLLSSTIIPVLEKDKSASHECAIVFFTPGRFKANIQCKSLAASTTKPLPNGHINFQLPQPGGLSTALSYHEMQSHLWKFIPPIELTVLE